MAAPLSGAWLKPDTVIHLSYDGISFQLEMTQIMCASQSQGSDQWPILKGSTIINYSSRVVKWGIFKSETTLES